MSGIEQGLFVLKFTGEPGLGVCTTGTEKTCGAVRVRLEKRKKRVLDVLDAQQKE